MAAAVLFLTAANVECFANGAEAPSMTMSSNYETSVTATAKNGNVTIREKVTVVCDDDGTPLYVLHRGNRRSVRYNGYDWEYNHNGQVFHFSV